MTGRVILALLAALLGVVAGLGAHRRGHDHRPAAAVSAGRASRLLRGLLPRFAARHAGISSLRKRRARAALFCTGTALIVGIFAWAAMLPVRDPRLPPASIEGQRFWDLPTGFRIAYVRVPAENRAREAPIFFLHGRQDRASKIYNAIDQIEQSEETAGDD